MDIQDFRLLQRWSWDLLPLGCSEMFFGKMSLTFRPNVTVPSSRVKQSKRVMAEFRSAFVTSDKRASLCFETNQLRNAVYWNNRYLICEPCEIHKQIFRWSVKALMITTDDTHNYQWALNVWSICNFTYAIIILSNLK